MPNFRLGISFLLFLSITTLYAQDISKLPKLEPSYFEDYNDYPSYPFQCLNDVFFDKYGKMWLEPCASVGATHSIYLYQFDGYNFVSKKHLFKGFPEHVNIHGVYQGEKIIAHTYIDSTIIVLEIDAYTEEVKVIDTGKKYQKFSLHAIQFIETKDNRYLFALIANDEIFIGELKDGEMLYKQSFPLERENVPFFFFKDEKNIILRSLKNRLVLEFLNVDTNERYEIDIEELKGTRIEKGLTSPNSLVGRKNMNFKGGARILFVKENNLFDFKPKSGSTQQILSINEKWQYKKSFGDNLGNWLHSFFDETNTLKAILEDQNGKLYDYSALFKNAGVGTVGSSLNVKSKNFKEEVFICNSQGVSYQKVKSTEYIDQYLLDEAIRSMIELEDGKILLISQSRHLFLLDLKEGSAEKKALFAENTSIPNTSTFLPYGKGKIIGNIDTSFIIYDYLLDDSKTINFEDITIVSFTFYDDQRVIILGADFNIYLFDLVTQEKRLITDQLPKSFSNFTDRMHFDAKSQDMWLATTKGLIKVNIESRETTIVSEQFAFEGDHFLSLHVDESERFWLGSSTNGIQIFDPTSGEIKIVDNEAGLPNNTIPFILADDDGDRWAGTYNGLAVLDKDGDPLFNLNTADGLSSREFNRLAYLKTRDGKLLLGTVKGVNLIDPSALKNSISDKGLIVYLVNLSKYNLNNSNEKERIPLLDSQNEKIVLSPSQRNLQVDFALSNLVKPNLNQYSYRLKGVYDEWISIGTQRSLELTNLPAGEYELQIKGRDAFGERTKEPLRITIKAKEYFYKQTWFYVLAALLIMMTMVGIAYSWIQGLRKQVRKATEKIRTDKEVIEQQAQELLEIDQAKSRFFTNISHEFRTPLTVILGMVNKMRTNPEKWLDRGGAMVVRNTNNVLNLINQILDLRKLESGKLELAWVQGNIISYLIYIFESFDSLAESKSIRLHLLCEEEELMMDYDREKLLRVLSNLLSNAIKFTAEGGDIYMIISQKETLLSIQIKDTGIGIPENKIDRVFDQFYQVDTKATKVGKGTGIGLALSKELVQLMGGRIKVESVEGKGSTFMFHLPIHREAPMLDELEAMDNQLNIQQMTSNVPTGIASETTLEKVTEGERPHILLVEDNVDVIQYLKACLSDQYNILTAENGQEGIEKAIAAVPDLVISDVMMPIKDGFELCDTLKRNDLTSHIPIILLTAKANDSSKISGLSKGADDYLTKPFNETELLIRINNLLEARKKLQRYFQRLESKTPTQQEEVSQEDEFLQKIRTVLEANLDDENFGILQICQKVGISRAQLHRKIKALTGQATSHYLRRIRLNKAKELLKNPDLNISEVAYEVGFRNPGYFSRSFIEEFGVSPNETRK